MDTKLRQTNTTELDAVLSHDDIVGILGLAAMMQGGIARDQPGTTVKVALVPIDGSDDFTATVNVVVDHNYVAPAQDKPDPAIAAPVASLNSDGATQPAPPPAPLATQLQIPGAPLAGSS